MREAAADLPSTMLTSKHRTNSEYCLIENNAVRMHVISQAELHQRVSIERGGVARLVNSTTVCIGGWATGLKMGDRSGFLALPARLGDIAVAGLAEFNHDVLLLNQESKSSVPLPLVIGLEDSVCWSFWSSGLLLL